MQTREISREKDFRFTGDVENVAENSANKMINWILMEIRLRNAGGWKMFREQRFNVRFLRNNNLNGKPQIANRRSHGAPPGLSLLYVLSVCWQLSICGCALSSETSLASANRNENNIQNRKQHQTQMRSVSGRTFCLLFGSRCEFWWGINEIVRADVWRRESFLGGSVDAFYLFKQKTSNEQNTHSLSEP